MPTWSFADARTGEFTGRRFTGMEAHLPANTRKGEIAVSGEHDPLRSRYDLATRLIVPSAAARAKELDADLRRASAQRALTALEERSLRALRELAINPDDAAARERLIELEKQAAPLRAKVRGHNGNATS